MPIFGGITDYSPRRPAFSPAARREAMRDLSRDGGGPLSDFFWLIDTPGAMARGTISGLAAGDPLRGVRALVQNDDERVSGRELIGQFGLDPTPGKKTWANFTAGLAAEMVTDPLAWMSGPMKALTPAGKIASKAGLLENAGEALSRKFLDGAASPEISDIASAAVDRIGRDVSPTDIIGRPLVGPRQARRYGTLRDVIDYAPSPEVARRDALVAAGGDEAALEAAMSSPLGRDIGFGLPFTDPLLSVSVPGVGGAYAATADAAADALRWSLPGRLYSKYTNRAVGGAVDAEDQMMIGGASIAKERAASEGRRLATEQAARLRLSEPDVFSEEGNRALGRSIEQPTRNPSQQADNVWQSSHPAARQYMQWWDDYAKESPRRFSEIGLRGAEFSDPNISGYLPRRSDGMLEEAGRQTPSLGRALSTMTSDQLQRADEMMVPGGRDTIAFDLSRDPFVAGTKRTARTDSDAASYISSKLGLGADSKGSKQAMALAQLLHKLPDHLIKEVPLFGQHPVEMITRYVEGREGAAAMQGALLDSLAYTARPGAAATAEGGRHISLRQAMQKLTKQMSGDEAAIAGADNQMRQRIARRFGVSTDSVRLSEMSVPEDVADRLARATETYTSASSSSELGQLMNDYTAAWKGSILSWPSKLVRDFYSGIYSNWLEGALSRRGLSAAKGLLAGGPEDPAFARALESMPLYSGADGGAARFWADLSATGLVDTGQSLDRGMAISGGKVLETMPGAVPETFFGAAAELGPQSGRSWRQYASDIAPRIIPSREQLARGPLVRAGAKAGNLVDRINRLSGYIELLTQGVSPQEAARRMKRAHVDYSSLTDGEKKLRDRLMPFYAYTSRSLQEVLRQMAERPGGRYGQGLRTYERAQESDEYTPGYMRQNFAAPIPTDSIFGSNNPAIRRFVTDVDLPGYDQLNLLKYNNPRQMGRDVAMMAHPAIRTLAELGAGEDFFTGQDLRKGSYGPLNKIYQAVTGSDERPIAAEVEKFYDLVPGLSRPTRAIAQAVDPRYDIDLPSRLIAAGITNTTGVKIRDATKDDIEREQIRRLQELASPYTREATIPFITEEMRPGVPRSARDALDMANQMQEERQRRKRRQRRD